MKIECTPEEFTAFIFEARKYINHIVDPINLSELITPRVEEFIPSQLQRKENFQNNEAHSQNSTPI